MSRQPSTWRRRRGLAMVLLATGLAVLAGCSHAPRQRPPSAFERARPASVLVLPPINDSVDVHASAGVLANVSLPLAEAGYYVFPVAVVDETFRQNGLTTPNDIHALPIARLREVYGADAALYLRIVRYGTSYRVLDSETRVAIEGRIVDLRSGQLLWSGQASASSNEDQSEPLFGWMGGMARALVNQIIDTLSDESYDQAARASRRLLHVGRPGGVPPGPRWPAGRPVPEGAEPPIER